MDVDVGSVSWFIDVLFKDLLSPATAALQARRLKFASSVVALASWRAHRRAGTCALISGVVRAVTADSHPFRRHRVAAELLGAARGTPLQAGAREDRTSIVGGCQGALGSVAHRRQAGAHRSSVCDDSSQLSLWVFLVIDGLL